MRLLALFLFLAAAPAFALTVEQPLADPLKEQQAREIFLHLKCMVCESQALAESDATLAKQMRAEVRDMLAHGKSEQEVLDTFVAHYGQQVLLNPPFERSTLLLWLAPLLLLGVGAAIAKRVMR